MTHSSEKNLSSTNNISKKTDTANESQSLLKNYEKYSQFPTNLSFQVEMDKTENFLLQTFSDSHSTSSTSFMSALTSQEDMTLINLNKHINMPAMDSPLLMSCYISHLTQVS